MKFIQVFDTALKNSLLKAGYELLSESGNNFVFINNNKLNFNFSDTDKQKYVFSNRLVF